LGIGAIAAPVVAGLLGAAGMAASPAVRLWLFAVPEAILRVVDIDRPSMAGLVVGWTIEFLPLGFIIAAISIARARGNASARAAAFEHAVTAFHDSEREAEYE
jgi:hypothetical protein